ncbi:MAG: MATE family efflux transporter [Clostridia bacterium]|nr:MATE family efflux transporter [Clostridia bacterium]
MSADKQQTKFELMTTTPVGRLIGRLAVPCIASMLVTSIYNMADTFFVGMLKSNAATGAVGVVFSMMAIIQATGFFFGHGSGNYISRMLGRQDTEECSRMAATGFVLSLLAGGVICVLGLIFLEPLAYLLGSTDTILPYTKQYLSIILVGAPWMIGSFVLNNQLRYQGSAHYGMVGIISGAILNIALDPLFIFALDMGVAGAGLATVISQFVSFCILLAGCKRGGNISIRISKTKINKFYSVMIIRGGLPSLARQGLASVATICLNHAAGVHGDAAIAALGVVQRIMMFGASAVIGFGQGFQPVCGFNFGAGLYDRVKQGFFFCVKVCLGFLLAVSIAGFIFADGIIALFRDDPEVVDIGSRALRYQLLTFPTQSWVIMSNMAAQSVGRTVPATFLAAARQGVFFIPLVWILSGLFGLTGILLTQTVSDVFTLICAIPIQLYLLRTIADPKKLALTVKTEED